MMNVDKMEYELGELLEYEQPTKYAVESTKYDDKYSIPVLTAGKSFILGYTNETEGIYNNLPVIIFDDFTTATQYVNFKFKVKSSAMKILKANKELALTKYLYYLMQTIHCDHDTHKRYWIQTYSKIKVAIPDITEQQRIVTKIEELFSKLDKGIEELNKIKEQLKIYRQAVLKEAFKHLSEDKYVPLSCILLESPQNGVYKPQDAYGYGSRILRIDGFYDGRIVKNYNYKRLSLSEAEIKKYRLDINDIVINRVNSMPYLGKCALVQTLDEDTVFESNMMRIKLDCQKALPEYVTYFLSSFIGRNQLIKNAKQAVNQASINQSDVGNAMIPLPDDMEVQNEVVKKIQSQLSVCDKIEQTFDESLQKAESLRQSILKQAFEGKLV